MLNCLFCFWLMQDRAHGVEQVHSRSSSMIVCQTNISLPFTGPSIYFILLICLKLIPEAEEALITEQNSLSTSLSLLKFVCSAQTDFFCILAIRIIDIFQPKAEPLSSLKVEIAGLSQTKLENALTAEFGEVNSKLQAT